MANLKLQYGLLSTMPSTITEGQFLVATDKEKAFVDVNGIRVPLGDVVTSFSETQIKSITKANALPKLYLSSDSLLLFYFDANAGEEDPETHEKPGAWKQVGGSVAHADSADADGAGNNIVNTYETKADATSKYNELSALIAAINSFEVQVVEALPTQDQDSHTLYFVRHNTIPTEPDYNVFDEYMWVIKTPASGDDPAVYGWELVGTTETDLTNFYTKTEADAKEAAIYTALGVTKAETEAAGFATFDARLDALESTAGTDGGRISELEAKFGTFNDSTAQGFVSVEQRFAANEADVTEIQAQLGNMAASTDAGFVSVEDRLSALESDTTDATAIAEINAKIGTYPASTDPDFVSIADRLDTAESDVDALQTEVGAAQNPDAASLRGRMATAESDIDSLEGRMTTAESDIDAAEGRLDTAESDIDELQAKFGAYADSTASGFQTVEARFTAAEGRLTTAEGDIDTAEADIDEVQAQLGNYKASTDADFVSIEDRFQALEGATDAAEIDELQAKFGDYKDSSDPDFVSVEDRFTAAEGRLTTAESDIDTAQTDITELKAKFGSYAASTAQGFESVEDRFTAAEGRLTTAESDIDAAEGRLDTAESNITALQTEVGDATSPAASSLRGRMATAEADIDEIEAKIGAYKDSTESGFVTIENRFVSLESAVGNINRFEVQVVQTLPAEGVPYTLYFVPQNSIVTNPDSNVYDEYMWVITTPASGDTPAVYGFEHVGTTETDLTNYYSKDEMDAIIGDASTSGTIIYRIKTNEDAIAELEAKFGAYADSTASGFQTVEARFTAAEGRLTTAEGDIDAAETRLDSAEADIDELQAKFGTYADSTAQGFESVEARFTADESDISTAQADITEINAKLGNMADSTDAGFVSVEDRLTAIEGGSISQTEDDDDAEKPMLVSGDANHSTVEYVPGVTVNAETSGITAGQLTLGAATLTYDTATGALVVNY